MSCSSPTAGARTARPCTSAEGSVTAAQNLFQFGDGERVIAVIDARLHEEHPNLVFVTQQGGVKRTSLAEFADASGRRDGIVAMKLGEGDKVVSVFPGWDEFEVLLVTAAGQGIRFCEEEVRPVGRSAGACGIRLKGDDTRVGGCARRTRRSWCSRPRPVTPSARRSTSSRPGARRCRREAAKIDKAAQPAGSASRPPTRVGRVRHQRWRGRSGGRNGARRARRRRSKITGVSGGVEGAP